MSNKELNGWICLAMMRLGTRMATNFDNYFATVGVTQAQFRILLAIQELGGNEGYTPSALADYLLIERGTISVLTNRMVENGWLSREPGKNRRTYQLVLTEAGRQMLDRVVPLADEVADAFLTDISESDLHQLKHFLELIEAKLRSSP